MCLANVKLVAGVDSTAKIVDHKVVGKFALGATPFPVGGEGQNNQDLVRQSILAWEASAVHQKNCNCVAVDRAKAEELHATEVRSQSDIRWHVNQHVHRRRTKG
jgi:hypothetical protein